MALLTRVGKLVVPLAGAVFLEPLFNLFAPSVKPLLRKFVESDEAKEFLTNLAEEAISVGPNVCTEFVANQAEKLLDTIEPSPKLEEALIAALRQSFSDMRKDLSERNKHNTLISWHQFFTDWDNKLKEIQVDSFSRGELLETKQFASLFYEWPEVAVEKRAWWMPVKTELEAWTSYASIPSELEEYLKENLLSFVDESLAITLNRQAYRDSWNQFQKSVGTQILSIMRDLQTHMLELKQLAEVASGQFIKDQRLIDFPLLRPINSLVKDLSAKEIYLERETLINDDGIMSVRGLQDLTRLNGYFLLAAPAGSGKSTLMARWITDFVFSLQDSGKHTTSKLCYHFYSKQEGTSDHYKGLTILSDQLLKAHNILANVTSFNPATIDSIIPISLELDHPAKLFVIVDGLDEAGAPATATDFLSLFKRVLPQNLGKNTTVILTLRDDEGANSLQHYRNELGLPFHRLEMREVSIDSLASYLSKASDDRLKAKSEDEKFIRQVIAKTEGLAIYVHYLLDELSQAAATRWPDIIEGLPRGFEKYVSASVPAALDGKPQWEDALSFIALTQSPLDEEDLIALTGFSGNKLKKVDFDRVSWNVKRWLRSENGFWAFSHQKIGEVFYNLYVESTKSAYIEHLLTHCTGWKQHKSRYVLQNYAELLRKTQKENELYELASDREFLNLQKLKLVENPTLPIRTLQTALSVAIEKESASMIARFSLLHAKTVEDISRESWLDAYNRRGVLGALEVTNNFNDDRKIVWYLHITRELVSSDRKAEAENVLQRLNDLTVGRLSNELHIVAAAALPTILQIPNFDLVRSVYGKILPETKFDEEFASASKGFARVNDFDKAKQCARVIMSPGIRSQALGSVGATLVDIDLAEAEQLFNEAEQVAHSIDDQFQHTSCYAVLASLLTNTRRADEAKELLNAAREGARSIEDPGLRSLALGSVCATLSAINLAEAEQLFDEAEQAARLVEVLSVRYGYFHRLVAHGAGPQLLPKTQSFIDSFSKFWEKAGLHKTLSTNLAEAGYFEEAAQIASLIKDSAYIAETRTNTVVALAKRGRFDEAETVALSIGPRGFRIRASVELASAFIQAQRFDEAERVIGEAEQLLQSLNTHRAVVEASTQIATVLGNLHQSDRVKEILDKARVAAHHMTEHNARARALRSISTAWARAGHYDEAEKMAENMKDLKLRAQALTQVASALAQAQRPQEAEMFFDNAAQAARSIPNSEFRSQALGLLASALAHAKYFNKAEELASYIKTRLHNAKTLSTIAIAFAHAGLFDEAERVARSIKLIQFRVKALGGIAMTMSRVNLLNEAKHLYDESKQLAIAIKDHTVRSITLGSVALALTDDQFRDEIKKAFSINHPWHRSYVLRNLATALMYAGQYDEAKKTIESIEDLTFRAQVMTRVATTLAQVQRLDEAESLFDDAEQVARSIAKSDARSQVLRYIASTLAQTQPGRALRIADELTGNYLIDVLDKLARPKCVEGLKKYAIPLSYKTSDALRVCAQTILIYENDVSAIYDEIRQWTYN